MSRPLLTALADFLICLLAAFIVTVQEPTQAKTEEAVNAGVVTVLITWPGGNTDVDLWVAAPGDRPVGYSAKGGRVFNLLRDDVGNPDPDLNTEIAVSRGAPAGSWATTLHGYRIPGPTPVRVQVRLQESITSMPVTIFDGTVTVSQAQEVTAVRFSLDDSGRLVPGSVHDLPIRLRG